MFKNIPQSRLLLYLLLLGMVPIALAFFDFSSKKNRVKELENNLEMVRQTAYLKERKQAANISVRNHFHDVDHFYIDKYVETMTFLEPEVESLQKILNQTHFAEDEQIKKRLEQLTSHNNMVFSEGVVQSSPLFQEVVESQVHPVEINVSDLQKILAKVEGVEMGSFAPGPSRPQLVIIDFKLDKKKITDKNEVFVLSMKLIKREYL